MLRRSRVLLSFIVVMGILFISSVFIGNGAISNAREYAITGEAESRIRYERQVRAELERFEKTYPGSNIVRDWKAWDFAARTRVETTAGFLFIQEQIPAFIFDEDFANCLFLKLELERENGLQKAAFKGFIQEQVESHGEFGKDIFRLIGGEPFFTSQGALPECKSFFHGLESILFKENLGLEFAKLVNEYKARRHIIDAKERKENERKRRVVNSAKTKLPSAGVNELLVNVDRNGYNKVESERFEFSGDQLNVTFSMNYEVFDEERFADDFSEIEREAFQTNSLSNGATPYRSCYGSNNSLSGLNGSAIHVVAPMNSDVLVIIKRGNRVVRHAYIASGNSFGFKLDNGTYTPYFYYGVGWNPNKPMSSSECGVVYGGFLSNESVGKDDPHTLHNHALTYTLILQSTGNFAEQPSNLLEAL